MCALDATETTEDLQPIIQEIKQEPQDEVSDIDCTTFSFIVKEEPSSPPPVVPGETQEEQQQQFTQTEKKPICHRQVQTTSDLVLHAPRIQKLRRALKTTENYNFALRQKLGRISRSNKSIMETISFQDYKRLTYAFCPSKSVADNVIEQVTKAREKASVPVTVKKTGGSGK